MGKAEMSGVHWILWGSARNKVFPDCGPPPFSSLSCLHLYLKGPAVALAL